MTIKRILESSRNDGFQPSNLKTTAAQAVAPWESALVQLRTRPDLVTLVGLKIITVVILIQPQRFDCRLIYCSRDWQAVIALEIRDSRPRIDAQRAGDWTIIVACALQRGLNVRDYFVGEQITVGVDRPIVVV